MLSLVHTYKADAEESDISMHSLNLTKFRLYAIFSGLWIQCDCTYTRIMLFEAWHYSTFSRDPSMLAEILKPVASLFYINNVADFWWFFFLKSLKKNTDFPLTCWYIFQFLQLFQFFQVPGSNSNNMQARRKLFLILGI